MSRDSERLLASAHSLENRRQPLTEVRAWLAAARDSPTHSVEQVSLDELDGWSFSPDGALAHHTGGFFQVAGARIEGSLGRWDQPLVEQPGVGTLGLLIAELDGLVHVCVQAKMEPGSPGLVQLAPTFQATHSNTNRLHRGRAPAMAEWFFDGRARVVAEAELPECGAHFSHKRNRNVIVELDQPDQLDQLDQLTPAGFRWLTLAELLQLGREPNLINMPMRSVLALIPFAADHDREHGLAELREWFDVRARATQVRVEPRPLTELDGWRVHDGVLSAVDDQLWTVMGVRVRAPTREVGEWCQPLLCCPHQGRVGLLTQTRAGRTHVLVEARFEPGVGTCLAPTLSADAGLVCPWERRAPALQAWFEQPEPSQVVLDVLQSREGGRYWQTVHRYQIVRVPESVTVPLTSAHRWVTLAQLRWFLRHTSVVHLDARELLSMLAPES